MTDKYQPSEAAISKLIEQKTPRQLAIAYLRANRRARQADLAFDLMCDLDDATDAIRRSDGDQAIDKLRRVNEKLDGGGE